MICIVGNKADLLPFKVDEEEARDFTKSINGHFALVSSKNGNGVQELLEESIKKYTEIYGTDEIFKKRITINNDETNKTLWDKFWSCICGKKKKDSTRIAEQ